MTTDDILIDYLSTKSPVHPGVEWRIGYLMKAGEHEVISSEPGVVPDRGGAANLDKTDGTSDSSTYRAMALMMILPLMALRST